MIENLSITKENYLEHVFALNAFFTAVKILISKNVVFFGGVVRDVIVPLGSRCKEFWKMNEIVATLDDSFSFRLNDIDVLVDSLKSIGFILNLFKTLGWKIEFSENDYKLNITKHGMQGCNCEAGTRTYLLSDPLSDTVVKVDMVIACSNVDMKSMDFDVNNLTWDGLGFGIIAPLTEEPCGMRSYDHFIFNHIENVITAILEKKAMILENISMSHKKYVRILKMLSLGFSVDKKSYLESKLSLLEPSRSRDDVDKSDRLCLICHDDIVDCTVGLGSSAVNSQYLTAGPNTVISVCGHDHFMHIKCAMKWWSTTRSTICPTCKFEP
jgi:hypothetical protein